MVVRVRIPAGRCVRREGTDSIDPCLKYGCPIYGWLALDVLDTELCELKWIDWQTGAVEESLMITPGESTFTEVLSDETGRTYALDFKGTHVKYFYHLQRADINYELENLADLNGYLQIPGYSRGSMPVAPRLVREILYPGISSVEANVARLAVLWAREQLLNGTDPSDSLANQLTSEEVIEFAVFQTDCFEHIRFIMPRDFDLPEEPGPDNMLPVLRSPHFRNAIEALETTLHRQGLPAELMYEMRLRKKDGMNWHRFLRCLHRLRPVEDGEGVSECYAGIEDPCHCDACEPPPDFSDVDEDSDGGFQFNDSEDGRQTE